MKHEGGNFTVALKSGGNPDHGQFLGSELLSPTVLKACGSILECQQAVRGYADQYGLGAGNWAGGEVMDGSRVIGRISYNGKFWPLGQPNQELSGRAGFRCRQPVNGPEILRPIASWLSLCPLLRPKAREKLENWRLTAKTAWRRFSA